MGRATDSLFDGFVGGLDPAVVVVTTAWAGERSGCLVGFHSQCSIEPRRYGLWLSVVNHTYRVAADASHVAVHRLDVGQHELARLFGGTTGDAIDKFDRCEWSEGPGGVPLLSECPARVVLRHIDLIAAGGDHALLVGEPIEADDETTAAGSVLRLSGIADVKAGHPPDG